MSGRANDSCKSANDSCSGFTSQPRLLLWAHGLVLHMVGRWEVWFTAHIPAFNLKNSTHMQMTSLYKVYIKLIATVRSVQGKQEGERRKKQDTRSQYAKTGTVRTRDEHCHCRTHLHQQLLPHRHLISRTLSSVNVVNLGISTLNINIYAHTHTLIWDQEQRFSLAQVPVYFCIFDSGAWITHLGFTVNQFLEGGVSCVMRPLYRGSFNVCKNTETDNLLRIRAIWPST